MTKTCGMPLMEAIELLTGTETQAVERHYGRSVDGGELSGTDLTIGVVWAWERRRALREDFKLPTWAEISEWTIRDLNGYFAKEELEADEEDPQGDQGKDDSLAA